MGIGFAARGGAIGTSTIGACRMGGGGGGGGGGANSTIGVFGSSDLGTSNCGRLIRSICEPASACFRFTQSNAATRPTDTMAPIKAADVNLTNPKL